MVLKPRSDTLTAECVEVAVHACMPSGRRGGSGFVHLGIANRNPAAQEVVFDLVDVATEGRRLRVQRRVALAAKTGTGLTLPLPCLGEPMRLDCDLGGPLPSRVGARLPLPPPSTSSVAVLALDLGDAARRAFDAIGAFDAPFYRSAGVHIVDCAATQLPANWQDLSGFELIVVDGADTLLTAPVQQLLLDYAAGGGRVVIAAPERLPPDAAELLRGRPGQAFARHGFGAVAWQPLGDSAADAAARQQQLCQWLTGGDYDLLPSLRDHLGGPLPRALHQPVRVPGIAGIPTNLFFLVTVVFVLLAGPVNHFWCRARGRPWLVLLTVPLGGFLVTGTIVGCSLWSEGLGTQGVIASASWLDQDSHRLTAVAASTVFAGTSPRQLRPDASTYLFANDLLSEDSEARPGLVVDAEANAIDGALLPSRRPTALASVTQRLCRERLRFRREADGGMTLLDGQGLLVLRQTDALILHDFDDRWWQLRSDGALRLVGRVDGLDAAASAVLQFEPPEPDPAWRTGVRPIAKAQTASAWLRARLLGHLQRPGSYCALVQQAPGVDDLGMTVRWSKSLHLVVGLLASEDIVR